MAPVPADSALFGSSAPRVSTSRLCVVRILPWHGPESFEPTTGLLEKAGFTVHGVSLPCVGADPPLPSFEPDRRAQLTHFKYGGVVGCEALKEYVDSHEGTKGARPSWGKVRRLVFVSAFVLPEGGSLMAALGFQPLPWFAVDGDAVNPVNPRDIFYNDLSDDAAAPHVWALRQHSYLAFASTLTAAPWKTVPSTYVLCEADHAIPLPVQEGMIAAAKEAAPSAFDVVERCGAGHSPFLSRPDWLADRLAESAR
ncbi:protein-tyrosine phosphatase [Diplocarpon rosae]|nr:protein-tyrosine phosphatase [Diplocarpon rosae]